MSIQTFLERLHGAEGDKFSDLVNVLRSSASQERIESLRDFQINLRDEIDKINDRRAVLGDELKIIEDAVTALHKYVDHVEGAEDADVRTFLAFLNQTTAIIREEIAEMRPDNKLRKKFEVTQKLQTLIDRRRIADSLYQIIQKNQEQGA